MQILLRQHKQLEDFPGPYSGSWCISKIERGPSRKTEKGLRPIFPLAATHSSARRVDRKRCLLD